MMSARQCTPPQPTRRRGGGPAGPEVPEARAGEIVAIAGIGTIDRGETMAALENPLALPPIRIDERTVSMLCSANVSPFSGEEDALPSDPLTLL